MVKGKPLMPRPEANHPAASNREGYCARYKSVITEDFCREYRRPTRYAPLSNLNRNNAGCTGCPGLEFRAAS